jgi:hypothetical protein
MATVAFSQLSSNNLQEIQTVELQLAHSLDTITHGVQDETPFGRKVLPR